MVVTGRLFEQDNPDGMLTAMRPATDGRGFFLHLTNPTSAPQAVRLTLPVSWRRATRSNALEEAGTPLADCTPPLLRAVVEPRSHLFIRLDGTA
jgi:hypothetical protein